MICKNSLSFVGCLFTFWMISFEVQKLLILMVSKFGWCQLGLPQAGWLTVVYVLTVLEAEIWVQGLSSHVFFLTCTQLLYGCVLTSERASSGISSNKDRNPILRASPPWPHLNLMISQRPHFHIPSHWGSGLKCMNFGEHNSGHSRWCPFYIFFLCCLSF